MPRHLRRRHECAVAETLGIRIVFANIRFRVHKIIQKFISRNIYFIIIPPRHTFVLCFHPKTRIVIHLYIYIHVVYIIYYFIRVGKKFINDDEVCHSFDYYVLTTMVVVRRLYAPYTFSTTVIVKSKSLYRV